AAGPGGVGGALGRLQGELKVGGFDAQVIGRGLGPAVHASLEKVAPTMAATAVVAVVAGSDPASAELWVVDRVTGKTVVRRVHAGPQAPARLAPGLLVGGGGVLGATVLVVAGTSRTTPRRGDRPVPRVARVGRLRVP